LANSAGLSCSPAAAFQHGSSSEISRNLGLPRPSGRSFSRAAGDARFPVRPRADAGPAGGRHRPRAKKPYVLALSPKADGGGSLEPLASFMTNPAGAAVVDAVGPIRQLVEGAGPSPTRYLVILSGTLEPPAYRCRCSAHDPFHGTDPPRWRSSARNRRPSDRGRLAPSGLLISGGMK